MSSDEALFPAHSQAPPSRGCCNPPQAPHRLRSLSPSAWTHCASRAAFNRFISPDSGKSAACGRSPPHGIPLLASASCSTTPPRQSCRHPSAEPVATPSNAAMKTTAGRHCFTVVGPLRRGISLTAAAISLPTLARARRGLWSGSRPPYAIPTCGSGDSQGLQWA